MVIAEIRKAKKGLVSNLSRGGKDIVVDLKKVPDEVKKIVKKVDSKLKRYRPRIYTVDFIFDKNNKPWLMELNSKPGFFGYEKYRKDMRRVEKSFILAVRESI